MKTKITLLIAVLFIGFNSSFAQNEEDMNLLSIFSEYAKAKNYEAAFGPWMELRQKNPKFNRAIYTYGEKILDHKIDNSSGAEQVTFIKDLVKLWVTVFFIENQRMVYPCKVLTNLMITTCRNNGF